ncbi:MAG: hypothetical protein ACFLMY_15665 [Candidatus Brachytrichaceae bacterium NZ_4S206]|jgi:hypothetical protein
MTFAPEESELISRVARELVGQLSPQELPLFRATSAAYFKDPAAVKRLAGARDDALGFGTSEAVNLIAPIALAVTAAVVSVLTQEVSSAGVPGDARALVAQTFQPVAASEAHDVAQMAQTPSVAYRVRLRELMLKHFDISELKTLCFDLGVDYESLGSADAGRTDKVRELILYFERRDRLSELVTACARLRPETSWTDLSQTKVTTDGRFILDAAQLARIRQTALAQARELKLTEARASLLADTLVANLAVT